MSKKRKDGENCSNSAIGYYFNVSREEMGEVHVEADNSLDSDVMVKSRPMLLSAGSLDGTKREEDKNCINDETGKDYWGLLGRSVSVDSNYQSPFSNPIETWKKLNELKGKITKTVEEKISEMKSERNASSPTKLVSSFSMSDAEDLTDDYKDEEQQKPFGHKNLSPNGERQKTDEIISTTNTESKHFKNDMEMDTELKNRKNYGFNMFMPEINIATAKTSLEGSLMDESTSEDVESGVEADENLDSSSFDVFDEQSLQLPYGGAQTPPGGSDLFWGLINYFTSLKMTEIYTVVFIVCIGLYISLPLTDFTRGFFACLLITMFCLKLQSFFLRDDSISPQGSFIVPDIRSFPLLKVPEYKPVAGVWINEYEHESYDPEYYSVTQTVPAYLQLDNAILKLSRPKGKISKRATFDEPEYKLSFSTQRAYNISGCNVFLMPEGLTRKRLFSKKYPIVIFLQPDSFIGEKNVEDKESDGPEDDFHLKPTPSNDIKSTLYLFARCDRQKEEWYRKLLIAARQPAQPESLKLTEDVEEKKNLNEPVTPFENVFFDAEVAQNDEYLRYMAKFVQLDTIPPDEIQSKTRDTGSWYKKLKPKKKESAVQGSNLENVSSITLLKNIQAGGVPNVSNKGNNEFENKKLPGLQIQWFNAFLNRILFDMFRSPYWLAKIHDKLYKKLNSIRLPYYIEEIEVIELDLGKTGPMFHRVSQPYIDERGLWFDMDITFDGMVKLTIQTHLNLVKLQKGIEEEEALRYPIEKEKGKKKAKEVKDQFLIKESNAKSKETINRTHKALEKEVDGKVGTFNKGADESYKKEENMNQKFRSVRGKSSNATLYDEVARIVEIAIEEGIAKENRSLNEVHGETAQMKSRSPIYDSEVEDSAESSEDEIEEEEDISPTQISPEVEEQPPSITRRYPKNRRSSKKLFRMFENVAQSKYFKSVAQSKYVQKAIAGVSATKLKLTLEIKSCSGTLTVNIPPPPSDRFWYGFRDMPKLIFSANPKIGEKAVRFAQIKNYLQRKILHEIKKAMVLPNMIDFVSPYSEPVRDLSSQQIADETTVLLVDKSS